jgi:peptidoglycan-associated lipoprotein
MQLNKVLKGLMLVLPVLIVTACSSHNNVDNDKSSIGLSPVIDTEKAETEAFKVEQARLQAQELQKNKVVYFDLDKYGVSPEFVQMLNVHAVFLRDNPSCKVTVEGHADERGTPEYNIALGERRATAVKMHLQSKGVSADQIFIVSYGKEKPAVLGYNETAYAKNRRAVLVY